MRRSSSLTATLLTLPLLTLAQNGTDFIGDIHRTFGNDTVVDLTEEVDISVAALFLLASITWVFPI